jgi:hypothetical protein
MFDFITAAWAAITEWLTRVWSAAADLIGAIPGEVIETVAAHPTAFAIGAIYAVAMAATILITIAADRRRNR